MNISIPALLDKQSERHVWRSFVEALPTASYLRPIMESIDQDVLDAIANDVVFVLLADRVREQRHHVADVAELQERAAKLKEEIRASENRIAKANIEMDRIRSDARILAGLK